MASATTPQAGMEGLLRLDRSALFEHTVDYFRRGGGTEPTVALVEVAGQFAVFKDYGAVPGWFARVLGPLLIAREAQALARLEGMAGVPVLYRRVDSHGVLMSFVPAEPWSKAQAPAHAFDDLYTLIGEMHARGVAHCDLRTAGNILLDNEGRPYLVDFVARVHRGRSWNLPWNWVFAAFCRADRDALAKLKVRFAPELATDAERERSVHRSWLARFPRALGMGIRSFTRLFVRRRQDG